MKGFYEIFQKYHNESARAKHFDKLKEYNDRWIPNDNFD